MNPAAILFFALVLPPFVNQLAPAIPQFAMLGGVALFLDGLVLVSYGATATLLGKRLERLGSSTAVIRIAGGLRLVGAIVLFMAI